MASLSIKRKWPIITLTVITVSILIPSWMYFSVNVADLSTSYPHAVITKDSISFDIKPGRPKNWVTLKQISSYGKWAIILTEDWSFYQHEGIDVNQIKIALGEMYDGSRFRGASTITQQMVKNVYLTEDRTIWRKAFEFILAQKAEKSLSKARILEIYLNCIEFGPNIFGIRNASYHYFKKSPSELNPKESAFLAMLLPSPKRYYVSFRNKRLTRFAKARITTILAKLRMGKIISPERYEIEKTSKLNWERD